MAKIAVYFFRIGDSVKIGPTKNLRQYYHKMKSDYKDEKDFNFIGFIPAEDYSAAKEIAEDIWSQLQDRRVADKVYRLTQEELTLLLRDFGTPLSFYFGGW